MTVLIKLFSIVLVGIISTSIAANAQKRNIHIESTQLIEANQQTVFDVLKSFEQYPEWSPFVVNDPEQKNHIEGEDGILGAEFHWEGVGEKSKGYQTLAELKDQDYLRMDCDISVPFKANPTFEYALKETEKGVKVVQTFNLKCSGFNYFMMKLFGVPKEMATTNQLGLDRLKEYIEAKKSMSTHQEVPSVSTAAK